MWRERKEGTLTDLALCENPKLILCLPMRLCEALLPHPNYWFFSASTFFFFLLYNNLLFVTLSEILEIMSFKIAVLGLGSKDNTFYEARYHTVDHFTAHILAVAKI